MASSSLAQHLNSTTFRKRYLNRIALHGDGRRRSNHDVAIEHFATTAGSMVLRLFDDHRIRQDLDYRDPSQTLLAGE